MKSRIKLSSLAIFSFGEAEESLLDRSNVQDERSLLLLLLLLLSHAPLQPVAGQSSPPLVELKAITAFNQEPCFVILPANSVKLKKSWAIRIRIASRLLASSSALDYYLLDSVVMMGDERYDNATPHHLCGKEGNLKRLTAPF